MQDTFATDVELRSSKWIQAATVVHFAMLFAYFVCIVFRYADTTRDLLNHGGPCLTYLDAFTDWTAPVGYLSRSKSTNFGSPFFCALLLGQENQPHPHCADGPGRNRC